MANARKVNTLTPAPSFADGILTVPVAANILPHVKRVKLVTSPGAKGTKEQPIKVQRFVDFIDKETPDTAPLVLSGKSEIEISAGGKSGVKLSLGNGYIILPISFAEPSE
jgi:hypothetical protein